MRRSLLLAFFAAACVCAMTSKAQAQYTRTWVSGMGDDVNPCSRTAPCKTFAGALSKTAGGGEIDVLDPGGFGQLNITKAITLDGGGGQVASVLASSSSGIVINAGASDRVFIRNMRINGINQVASTTATNGIGFNSGLALTVQNCVIHGFLSYGINFQPSIRGELTVVDTVLEGDGTVATAFGGGIIAATPATTGGVNKATIRNVTVSTSVSGITAGANTKMALDSVTVAEGGIGGGDYGLIANAATAEMNVIRTMISGNQFGGVHASNGATIRMAYSAIVGNNTNGILIDAGSFVQTFGNNVVAGNSGSSAFSSPGLSPT